MTFHRTTSFILTTFAALSAAASKWLPSPVGLARISACFSHMPCIVHLCQDGAFDFAPVSQ